MAKDSKNSLIDQSATQVDNYEVKPESFPSGGGQKHGAMAEGANQLSNAPCGVRHLEDGGEGSGPGTPSVWGKGGSAFSVEKNKGEGDSAPSKVSISYGVDFSSGQVSPNVETVRGAEN